MLVIIVPLVVGGGVCALWRLAGMVVVRPERTNEDFVEEDARPSYGSLSPAFCLVAVRNTYVVVVVRLCAVTFLLLVVAGLWCGVTFEALLLPSIFFFFFSLDKKLVVSAVFIPPNPISDRACPGGLVFACLLLTPTRGRPQRGRPPPRRPEEKSVKFRVGVGRPGPLCL